MSIVLVVTCNQKCAAPKNIGVILSVNFTLSFPYCGTNVFHKWIANCSRSGSEVIVHRYTGIPDISGAPGSPKIQYLSPGAQRILDLPNAGGNSVWSEVMSFEVIRCLFNCELAYTEMELAYFPYGSSITDYSINVTPHISLGVSVTRAMAFRRSFMEEDAVRLLKKKLYGVTNSTRCVDKSMRWRKQILHVWVQEDYMLPILLHAYFNCMNDELRTDTLVLFTVSVNAEYLYTNVQ